MKKTAVNDMTRLGKYSKIFLFFPLGAAAVAVLIAVFVQTSAVLLLCTQMAASAFEYNFQVSDQIARAVLTVGGALAVGCLALYGVHRQNVSAEQRHMVDSSLALRKEIFLQFADATAVQFQYLLSFALSNINEVDRNIMIEKNAAIFLRLQMVASQETISAMVEANEEWSKAVIKIRFLGPMQNGSLGPLNRLNQIQKLTTPFMHKLWEFNIVARKEIGCGFTDDMAYFGVMRGKFDQLGYFLVELEDSLREQSEPRELDFWIVKQLRAAILSDLRDFIPVEYFETLAITPFDTTISNHAHRTFEMNWGNLAATKARTMFFCSNLAMSPRQVAATEMLLHLGLLTSTSVIRSAHTALKEQARKTSFDDSEKIVGSPVSHEGISQLIANVTNGLRQYLLHLSVEDALPFRSLLDDSIPARPLI